MLSSRIATIGLLALGALLLGQPPEARAQGAGEERSAAAQARTMSPELEKAAMARGGAGLVVSFDNEGMPTPFHAEGATTREMDDPVPDEASDVKVFTVYVYRKNPHCYSYWTGSKWVEVCPQH